MPAELTETQKQQLVRNGYLVVRGAASPAQVSDARRLIFERMGALRAATSKVLAAPDFDEAKAQLNDVLRNMGRSGGSERIMDLFEATPAKPLLESAIGGPVAPVQGAQLATLYPAEDELDVNEAGFRNVDTPFHGWCGHLDGLWNGATATPPVDRKLTASEEEAWQAERSTNGGRRYYPEFNTNISSFTALVGVALSDQRQEGSGNLGLLKGGHKKMAAFFRWQRDQGGPLGPEGPGWPRVDEKAPNRHGLVHYPDRVKQAYRRGAVISPSGQVWPKPQFMKLRAGDAVIVHHATPHSGSRVLGADPRLMAYFRTRAAARPEVNETVYPEALCDEWLEWQGLWDYLER